MCLYKKTSIKIISLLILFCFFLVFIANATKPDIINVVEPQQSKLCDWECGLEFGLKPEIDNTRVQGGFFLQYYVNKHVALESGIGYDGLQYHYKVYGLYIKGGVRLYLLECWNLGIFYKPYIPLNGADISYSEINSKLPDMATRAAAYWGQLFFDFGFKTSKNIYINLGISVFINFAEWESKNDFWNKGNKNIDISGLKSFEMLPYIFLRYDVIPLFRK